MTNTSEDVVEPSDVERGEWPDTTRLYVEWLEENIDLKEPQLTTHEHRADLEAETARMSPDALDGMTPAQARREALEEALEIASDVSVHGSYFGDSSLDTTDSIYQQGAFEVFNALEQKLSELAEKEQG